MRRIVTVFCLFCTLSLLNACQKETPSKPIVLSTIKPINALVYAIGAPIIEAKQLLPDNASPHTYQPRPSDVRSLEQADIIIQIDPLFEGQFAKAFQHLRPEQILVVLSQAAGVQRLPARILDDHAEAETDTHSTVDHTASEQDGHEHEHGSTDFHLWLDPDNGIAMARHIQQVLSSRYPEHASEFAHNAEQLIEDIQKTDQHLQRQFAPLHTQAFIAFHDAWQYFDRHYQLHFAGTVSNNLSQQLSAYHLQALKKTIAQQHVTCVFHEPQFSAHTTEALVENFHLNSGEVDPLGAHLPLAKDTYPQLLQQIGDQMSACLQAS